MTLSLHPCSRVGGDPERLSAYGMGVLLGLRVGALLIG
jgi:hypothetical protein